MAPTTCSRSISKSIRYNQRLNLFFSIPMATELGRAVIVSHLDSQGWSPCSPTRSPPSCAACGHPLFKIRPVGVTPLLKTRTAAGAMKSQALGNAPASSYSFLSPHVPPTVPLPVLLQPRGSPYWPSNTLCSAQTWGLPTSPWAASPPGLCMARSSEFFQFQQKCHFLCEAFSDYL